MHAIVYIALLSLQSTRSEVVLNNDEYYGYFGKMFQKMRDGMGVKWEQSVSPMKLELLSNDVLNLREYKSCVHERQYTGKKENVMAQNVTFDEIAKAAGFHHVHRDSQPSRPYCQFDYVIASRGNYTSKLSGELCTMEMLTGGAAVGDYDNDGLEDIFFTVYNDRSLLYRNNGDGTFKDVTASANVGPARFGNGAGWVDVDSDGDLDLYVTTVGDTRHYLYINHDGHFTEEALTRGVSLQAANQRKLAGFTPSFGDFDQDGYLDMYVSEWMYHSISGKVSASRLFRNMGSEKPGHFADVTDSAGVNMDGYWSRFRNKHGAGTHTFGSSFTDFDNDGWPELFITGDFGQSKVFWNNRNGSFSECTKKCGVNGSQDAMGQAIGDINNDGKMDAFLSAIYYTSTSCRLNSCSSVPIGNGFYQNDGNRRFKDITDEAGVRNGYWAWGASFLDFDNDGYLDLVSTNGMDGPATTLDDEYGKDNMQLFHNQGEGMSNKMVDIAAERGMNFFGLGRGLLIFDYDNDGDEDVVVMANVGPPQLFKNNGGNINSWLRVTALQKCLNNPKRFCESYGARISVTTKDSKTQMSMVGSKSHFLGQSERTGHFGFGLYNETVKIEVYWPRTKKKVLMNEISVNQRIKVFEPENGDVNVSSSALRNCPSLQIKEITMQPTQGKVSINQDKFSVTYNPGAETLFDVGIQHFKYSVQVSPSSLYNLSMVNEGMVTLDFRVTPNIYPVCKNGRAIIAGKETVQLADDRRLDGKSNNMPHLHWGSAKEDLLTIAPHSYVDNVSEPAAACTAAQTLTKTCPYPMELSGIGSNRPSPREISNTLMSQTKDHFSKRNLSDLTMHFGQFLAHDTDHSSPLPRFEFQYHHNHVWMPITIPKGDVHFDAYGTGKEKMPFIRSSYNRCTGSYPGGAPRKQFNQITAYIDANMVYGVSVDRCSHLREYKNGRMRIGSNLLLPKNKGYLANENPTGGPAEELYIAGDIRANVQPGLMSLHTLFVREHNRLAHQFKLKNPMASDEETFQNARRLLISEVQAITYNEYLPAILGGKHHLSKYKGYKDDVDTGITNEFATAAFRFGHSQVNSFVFRLQKDGTPIKEGHGLLREMYFKPSRLEREGGVDPIFRGAVHFPAQEIDLLMVDEMRNTLFPTSVASPGKQTGFDLASLNIQRGRDHGLSDLNTVRKKLNLKAYSSFSEITSNKEIVEGLKKLYRNINNIDLWIGGLAEDHVKNSELGETFHAIIVEQFTRIRDGDRFWYQEHLTKEEIVTVESTTMSKIIRMNTGFDECPKNVFFAKQHCIDVKDHQCVPKPASYEKQELEKKNEELKDETRSQEKTIEILIAVAGILGVTCFIILLIALKTAVTKKKCDEVKLNEVKHMTPDDKTVIELGNVNVVAEE